MSKAGKANNDIKKRFAEISDLPKELVTNYSKMILVGNNEFTIENYRGIIEYEEHKIRLSSKTGEITVYGRNLSINELDNEELLVTGKITSIEIESEE